MTGRGPFEGARRLLRRCRYGTLATLDGNGAPFATLVALASDGDGAPLMLLSDLARHTAHLRQDSRASVLLDDSGVAGDRLAGARLTLTGSVAAIDEGGLKMARRRYLARHPEALALFDLSDFRFYRLCPDGGHLVAGFGHISGLTPGQLLVETELARALAAVEREAIEHLHADHRDALVLLADADDATVAALDADGIDLLAGTLPVRRDFGQRLTTAAGLRAAIVQLVRKARKS